MIQRTTARCGADYEWGVHVAFFGAAAGFSDTDLPTIAHGAAKQWPDAAEAVLLATADALHARSTLSDAEHVALAAHYTAEQIIEIVMLAGLYHAVSLPVPRHRRRARGWRAGVAGTCMGRDSTRPPVTRHR